MVKLIPSNGIRVFYPNFETSGSGNFDGTGPFLFFFCLSIDSAADSSMGKAMAGLPRHAALAVCLFFVVPLYSYLSSRCDDHSRQTNDSTCAFLHNPFFTCIRIYPYYRYVPSGSALFTPCVELQTHFVVNMNDVLSTNYRQTFHQDVHGSVRFEIEWESIHHSLSPVPAPF